MAPGQDNTKLPLDLHHIGAWTYSQQPNASQEGYSTSLDISGLKQKEDPKPGKEFGREYPVNGSMNSSNLLKRCY